ncbi:hypothetical protein SERLA73DRAFT_184082, partial [Serpula lacrymans var. lacrymans S7.3]
MSSIVIRTLFEPRARERTIHSTMWHDDTGADSFESLQLSVVTVRMYATRVIRFHILLQESSTFLSIALQLMPLSCCFAVLSTFYSIACLGFP